MIRVRPGEAERALEAVQAVHRVARADDAAAEREVADVADGTGPEHEVVVERHDDPRLGEVVLRHERRTERHLGAADDLVVRDRVVVVPAGPREARRRFIAWTLGEPLPCPRIASVTPRSASIPLK